MTQGEFADHLQTSQSTISKWESGWQRPSQRQVLRILDELRAADDARDRLVKLTVEQAPGLRSLRTRDHFLLAASQSLADRLGLIQSQCRWYYFAEFMSAAALAQETVVAEAGFYRGEVAFAEYGAAICDALGRPVFHAVKRLFPLQLSALEFVSLVEMREVDLATAAATRVRIIRRSEPDIGL